jgi:hypothetical protein
MTYEYAHSPSWESSTSINLTVKFDNLDHEIPFVAHQDDVDPINRELFEKAANGDFGALVPYVDPARQEILDLVWDNIQAIRDEKTMRGGAKVGNYWFHSDTHSKLQQLALLIAGNNLPPGVMWKTMSGEKVEMTPQLAQQIYYAQMIQEQTLFGWAEFLRAQSESMEFPDQLDINSGWTETYK